VPLFEYLLPDMAGWAMQLYRGRSFGGYFGNFQAESSKPLIVTEFGIDAYNDPCGWNENMAYPQVCFNLPGDGNGGDVALPGQPFRGCNNPWADCAKPGVQTQAEWDAALVHEIMANAPEHGGAVIGGFVMAWTDEYWKGAVVQDQCAHPCPVQDLQTCLQRDYASYALGGWAACGPHAHFTCGNYDTKFHDLCGYALAALPDGYVNEEWFGITAPVPCHQSCSDCGFQLDALTLRPAYHAIKAIWNPYVSGQNATQDVLAPTCNDLLPCYQCLKKFPEEELRAGRCDEFCKDPVMTAPLEFWSAYGTVIGATVAILVLAALAIIAVVVVSKKRGYDTDTAPLLQYEASGHVNYHSTPASSAY